jgi:hypothetical protein
VTRQVYRKVQSLIIPLDRANPFDLRTYGGLGWSIEEQDERSLALTEVDLGKIQLITVLGSGETSISRRGVLNRLKAQDYIRLDAKVLQILIESKSLIPEAWKQRIDDDRIFAIFFDGTIFRTPEGRLCTLFLFWGHNNSGWCWLAHGIELDSGPNDVSATLPNRPGQSR